MTVPPSDGWNAGSIYEEFMGRWSRPLAWELVSWLDVPALGHWLDVGTGTGAVPEAICAVAIPGSVLGCDPSQAFVEAARERVSDSRFEVAVAGVGDLPAREGGYDAVVSSLALNFFPDPEAAVEEQLELTKAGGVVAASVWDYAGEMQFLRYFWDAATRVDPRAAEVDEGQRFPLCAPDALERLFEEAGARDVRSAGIEVPTEFSDFDDFWRPFLGGTGPAPSFVAKLSEGQRETLSADLRGNLPQREDGSISLV
ncbi:MAG: methyltransferase domain-containing protein, partial [Thermoanaerobaculia bacterium]